MSMREALAQSRNIPALKAFQAVGKDAAVDFANGLGLGLDKDTVYESYSIEDSKRECRCLFTDNGRSIQRLRK